MKQARKTHLSSAKQHVNRVVATIALATAAGAAASPAFASESDDRDRDGFGRDLGADDTGARFGGSEGGVEVKDDGTVQVLSEIVAGAVESASDATGNDGAGRDVVSNDVEDVIAALVDVTPVVEDTSRDVADAADAATAGSQGNGRGDLPTVVDDVVDRVTGRSAASEQHGTEAGTGGSSTAGEGRQSGKGHVPGADKKEDVLTDTEPVKDADYWAPAAIDYSYHAPEDRRPVASAEADDDLLAFEETAKALGYGPKDAGTDYEPRHRAGSPGEDAAVVDVGGVVSGVAVSGLRASGLSEHVAGDGLLGHLGAGDVRIEVTKDGVTADVNVGGVRADVDAGGDGLTVEADVPGVADVAAGAARQGVKASVDVADVAGVEADAGQEGAGAEVSVGSGGDAQASGEAVAPEAATGTPSASATQPAREDMLVADRGAEYASGAEFMSNPQSGVDEAAATADSVTEQATIDAPLRMATTGSEAAALTGAAGALVVGGAAALIVANRSGRREGEFALSKVRPAL